MFDRLTTLLEVLAALRTLRGHERWARSDIAPHQSTELAALRAFAYHASPFYRDFHKGYEHAPLSELPILTKSLLMENFDSLATDRALRLADVRAHLAQGGIGRFQNRFEVVTTSGSTGSPGIFMFNRREWATIIASFARAREWAGLRLNLTRRSSMAVVSSTNDLNVSARVGKVANTPFLPTLRLDAGQSLPEIVAALNIWQPQVLVAYASMAHALVCEQAAGRLAIHPHTVFTSSEVLTHQMRQRLVEVWGEVVFDEYASTETATIAAEDTAHHGMHVFEDLLIVENVDADNRPVPPGMFGDKLLVTVLFSRTQPLIRYEISDSIRFSSQPPHCHLPFQVIDAVQGRKEDTLVMAGRNQEQVPVHPNVFHDVMDTIPNSGWQIVEDEAGLHILIVAASEGFDAADIRERIAAALSARDVAVPTILVEQVEAIPKASSGKTPLIKARTPGG